MDKHKAYWPFFFFPPPHYGVLHSLGLEEQMVVSESGLEKVWRGGEGRICTNG